MKYAIESKNSQDITSSGVQIEHEQRESVRLNKYISESGYCSRRQADRYISEGVVYIDGQLASTGQQVFENQEVMVEGNVISKVSKTIYLVLNKPVGITCTTLDTVKGNISEFMNYPLRIFPVGRLDKDSQGLIMMTNDGDVVNKILRAHNQHQKEYIVSVDHYITDTFIETMSQGVYILEQMTHPCVVERISNQKFKIILQQGLNRQIRRMCQALGYRVVKLERVRIMNIELNHLPVGHWRYLTLDELSTLNNALANSDKTHDTCEKV